MRSFKGKVAAITGAGSGIGQALAVALAREGCHLALSDINQAGLDNTVRQVRATPAGRNLTVTTALVDVSKLPQMQTWARTVQGEHGKVNMIFNNAGVALASTVEGASYADYEWLMGINFWGVVYGTKEFLPLLKQSGDGHIINISSLFGLTAQPTQSAYNASKFAVRGFTESLRQELDALKCGVSCTSVQPGGIRTNIARAARINDSINQLDMDPDSSPDQFESLLRCPPETAAQAILKAVRRDDRRVLVGNDARVLDVVQRVMPTGYQVIMGRAMQDGARLVSWSQRLKDRRKKA